MGSASERQSLQGNRDRKARTMLGTLTVSEVEQHIVGQHSDSSKLVPRGRHAPLRVFDRRRRLGLCECRRARSRMRAERD
jgi:hypothetical protein